MKRKLIRQGHNTFTITVPIKWAKRMGLNAGDEVDVLEQGSSLVINAGKGAEGLGKTSVDITGLPNPLLWRFVSSAYRAGFDEIRIDFEGIENNKEKFSEFSYDITDWFYKGELPKDRVSKITPIEAIQALVNRFIGVEITEQKQDYVVIKQFGDISYNEFDNALRRIFGLTASMGNDLLSALEKKNLQAVKGIHMIDTNIDRFEDYCLRVLNAKGYEDFRKLPVIYSIIFMLELIGDEYKRISKHILRDGHVYGGASLKFFKKTNEQFAFFLDFFYSPNREKAIKIFEKNEELGSEVKKLLKAAGDDEKELLHHLKKITYFIISLTELTIDLKPGSAFEAKGK